MAALFVLALSLAAADLLAAEANRSWLLITGDCYDPVDQVAEHLASRGESYVVDAPAAAAGRTRSELSEFDFVYVGVGSCFLSPLSHAPLQQSVSRGAIAEWVAAGGVIVLNIAHNDAANYEGPGGSVLHAWKLDGVLDDRPMVVDPDHEYISGFFGTKPLGDSDFARWFTTVHGQIEPPAGFVPSGGVNLGTGPAPGQYNEIIRSGAGASGFEAAMLEYVLGAGYVLMSSIPYDWGTRPRDKAVLHGQIDYAMAVRDNFPLPVCGAQPRSGCRSPERAVLMLRDKTPERRNRLAWKWRRATRGQADEIGDPLDGFTSYHLCVYDWSAGSPRLATSVAIPSGGVCANERPCWRRLGRGDRRRGFRYRDRYGTADGIVKLKIRSREDGPARIVLRGKGGALPLPGPATQDVYLEQDSRVVVQLVASDAPACWEAAFWGGSVRGGPDHFVDRCGTPDQARCE